MIQNIAKKFPANWNRIRRLSKEGSWILAGQAASVLGALALVRVLTEYLQPEEYGRLALGLTIATLGNQVVTGGVCAGIGRFYSIATEKGDLNGYLRASYHLMGYATLAIGFIAVILISVLYVTGKSQWLELMAAVLVFSLLNGYNSALTGIQNAARQRAVVALHGGMNAWLKIGLAVSIILWLECNSTAVVIAYAVSTLLITGSQLLFLRRLLQRQGNAIYTDSNENWIRQMWLFSWPMMASGLFNWGYYASQRWALELFVSSADVGKFYALTQIAYTPISLAGSLFLSFIIPILYLRVGDPKNHDRVTYVRSIAFKMTGIGIGATLLMGSVAMIAHETIFRLLVAEKYQEYSSFMPIIVVAAGLLQSSIALGSILTTVNRTKALLPLAILGQSIIIVSNIIFTQNFGIDGLVYSMLGGACLHIIWMYHIVLRQGIQNHGQ